MNKINFFSNPYYIFLMFLIVSLINIIMSVHFISIFLAGFVFIAFIECLKNRYLYSLFFVILTFVFIEVSHGLNIGLISLVSFFIYIFIKPTIKYMLSSKFLFNSIILFIFYFFLLVLFKLNGKVNSDLIYNIFYNYLFDLFLLGLV